MAIDDEVKRVSDADEFANKTKARRFCVENREWVAGQSRKAMASSGCPTPHSCGQELCQELILESGKIRDQVWSEVNDPERYISKIARRKGYEKKEECGCGDSSGYEDEHELDTLIAEARPKEVWDSVQQMETLILFREVAEHLSKEEQAILIGSAEGHQSKDLARQLGITSDALRKRKSRLLEKLRNLFSE